MQARTRTLQETLQVDRRFVIPVYQRPYVWEQEKQWEPLWADVESTAIRLAETRQAAHKNGIPAADADRGAAPHFLGAIVLEQHPTATGDVDMRSVVDGQQRLTTLQLLLMGVLDALNEVGIGGSVAARLRKLTRNDPEVVSGEALHKVRPRPAEQKEYLAAVAPKSPPAHASVFSAARVFFRNAATEFITDEDIPVDPYFDGHPEHGRASLLVATLLGLVKVVVIDLDDVDDAQVIFEALNARSTPLSATDLVKNLLFLRAQAEYYDADELYPLVWARFDDADEWWREETGVGHAQRARQDWLLGDWLIAQLGRVINVGRLYGEFRRWLDTSGTGPLEALKTLNVYADCYESLHGRMPGATPAEEEVFDVINRRLNITAATPVLLWLLAQPEERLSKEERQLAFQAIKSFVVRRMAAKAQTRAYNQAFAEVLKAARDAEANPGFAVIRALRGGPHGYEWPTDAQLVEQFRTTRYYGAGGINQSRLRLLLGGVDQKMQEAAHKAEPVDIQYDALQVEHVIPQEWKTYWPVQASGPNEQIVLEQERESHVHRIGNLTLASKRLNPSMGNDPWSLKRAQLRDHSKLRLNALLCDEEEWTEERIRERGERLARHVAEVWPGPEADIWPAVTAPPETPPAHVSNATPEASPTAATFNRRTELSDFLQDYIRQLEELVLCHSSTAYVRFIPAEADLVPLLGTGWPGDRLVLFEFDLSGNDIRLKGVLGPGDAEARSTFHKCVKDQTDVFNRADSNLSPQWWAFHSVRIVSKSQLEEESIEHLKGRLENALTAFVANDMPKVVGAFEPLKKQFA